LYGYVWLRKHAIAFGSHCLRFRVTHRHVTKGWPRAHLGSFGRDHLGRIEQRAAGVNDARLNNANRLQMGGRLFVYFELLASGDIAVVAYDLAECF